MGVFVHWGLFSVPSYGGERSAAEWFWENWVGRKEPQIVQFMERNYLDGFTYPDFAPQFRAELYDPLKWVDLFERAGAKYVYSTPSSTVANRAKEGERGSERERVCVCAGMWC